MPTVPYSPVPGVTPSTSAPADYLSVQASPNDFGAQVGQSIEKLGGAIGQSADYLSQHALAIQGMNNERDALNANTDAQQKMGAKWASFAGLNGQDAADAYPQFLKDINQIHQDAMAGLQSPEARQMLDRAGQAMLTRFDFAASTKAADEQRKSWGTANVSAAASAGDQAVLLRNDPNGFATQLTVGRGKLADAAGPNGWDDQTLKLKQQEYTDQTYSKAVSAIATNDPMGALSWYQDHKDQIGGDAQAAIERSLKPLVMANQSRVVAGNIVGGVSNVAASAVAGEASAQGQDPKRALTWASLESGVGTVPDKPGNPHTGLFQMGPDEWKSNGGAPSERGQVPAEARVGVKSMSASMAAADDAVGGHAADWQGYLVHQQGQAGGPALLKADPNANVVDALAPAYKGDRNVATQAIAGNGGNPAGSVGAFLGVVQARYAKAESAVTVPDGAPQSTDIRDEASSMLAQARNTPDPFGGDDPAWHDMLESRVRSRIGEIEYGQAQTERAAQQTLLTAAIGAPTGGAGGASTKPTDLSVLMQQPDFASAWLSAKPETQRGIMQILEHNAVRVEPPLSQDAMSRYYQLLGERGRDPDAFMKENLADPDLVKLLPSHLLLGLMTEQKSAELKSAAETEKQVNQLHALSVVKPDLLAAGIRIPTKPGEQAQVYDQFVGRFSDALDQWKSANKKQPADADVRAVGQSLLTQGYQTGGGWFGNDTATRLFQSPEGGKGFYVQPPAADRTAIIRDWQTVHPGTSPSETQIRQVYTQSKLRIRSSSAEADPNAALRGSKPPPAAGAGSPASP